jgi:hypothetical protein
MMRLIDAFAPHPDARETHQIEIAASPETVYQVLWTADLGGSSVMKGLMALRSLPEMVFHPGQRRRLPQKVTLQVLLEAGFGKLAEEAGREIVLGVAGRFWRPTDNILPFKQEYFQGPVPPGLARALLTFRVQEMHPGRTLLSTETRVVCGDEVSRWKFRAYWVMIKPCSGLLRRIMLRAIRRACEGGEPKYM